MTEDRVVPEFTDPPIFKDFEFNRDFKKNGYIILPRLLDDSDLESLKSSYERITSRKTATNSPYGVYYSYIDEESLRIKKELSQIVYDKVVPKCQNIFDGYEANLGGFLIKAPGDHSYTFPHQDWTMVEEGKGRSLTIWIPLVDVDEHNGALGIIKGSHRFFSEIIGAPSPAFKTPMEEHRATLYEYLKFVPLKAGEAIVFDKSTIHGATPNLSGEARICVGLSLNPRDIPLSLYYQCPGKQRNEERQIARLEIDEDFFYQYPPEVLQKVHLSGQMPDGYPVKERFLNRYKPISKEELEQFLHEARLAKNGYKIEIAQTSKANSTSSDQSINMQQKVTLRQRLLKKIVQIFQ